MFLHFLGIGRNLPIVDLNIGIFESLHGEVFGGFKGDAFVGLGEEGFADGFVGAQYCLALAGPVELIAFGCAFDEAVGKFLAQQVQVDSLLDLAVFAFGFGHAVGKQPANGVKERGCVFGHGFSGSLDFCFSFGRRD